MAGRRSRHPEITPELLLRAYSIGLFPMADSADDPELFWVEPDMRGVIPLDGFHVSRSLARTIRRKPFDIRFDTAFDAVVAACAEAAPDRPSTWINAKIKSLYGTLHRMGHAHSVEAWEGDTLVGDERAELPRPRTELLDGDEVEPGVGADVHLGERHGEDGLGARGGVLDDAGRRTIADADDQPGEGGRAVAGDRGGDGGGLGELHAARDGDHHRVVGEGVVEDAEDVRPIAQRTLGQVAGPSDGGAGLDPGRREGDLDRGRPGDGSEAIQLQVGDAAVAPHLLLLARQRGGGEPLGRRPTTGLQPGGPGQGRGGFDGESAQGIGPLLEGG